MKNKIWVKTTETGKCLEICMIIRLKHCLKKGKWKVFKKD